MFTIFVPVVLFCVGLVLIVKGGDYFVDSARWISLRTGIPKMIVGCTIVSLATTLPELLVSITATSSGLNGIAIGNAVGSVTANTGLIMGLSLLMMPVAVARSTIIDKGVLLIGSTFLLLLFSLDGELVLLESIILFGLLAVFVYLNVRNTLVFSEGVDDGKDTLPPFSFFSKECMLGIAKFVGGAVSMVIGARLLIVNGEFLARSFGVSEAIIGLSIVAIGTSLPELATTLTAIKKGESELSVGNILGANTIDITMILATCSFISKDGLVIGRQTIMLDLPITLLLIVIGVVPALITQQFKRWQAALMLGIYFAYMIYITMFI